MQTDEDRGERPAKGGSLEAEWLPDNEAVVLCRWIARVQGVIVAGFSLLMFIGESSFPPPIGPMALFGGYAIGMFLALKWERAGAMLGGVSAALLLFVMFRARHNALALAALWGGVLFFVFSLPVLLYLLCWWLEERDRRRYRVGS